ncbi:MAG: flagellar hook-associated protein FlgL [Methylomonas sp.]|nr:flagellar hook-associated protein FlgL [Methylomonas sp.]
MRISTLWQYQVGVSQMQNQQSKLTDTQMKMATGKKYLTPSENPQAATSLIDFNQRIDIYEQFQTNIGMVRQRLELENSAIDAGINVVMQIRDLAVQGLNDVNQGTNRAQIAEEIDQLQKQLLTIANTQNPNGDYLFSGYASNKQPFDGSFQYQGDDQRSLAIGPGRTMADGNRGDDVFGVYQAVPTAGSIDNVLQAISQLSTDLKNNAPQSASLADFDKALDRFSTAQVSVGARLNTLDMQESLNEDYIIDYKSMVSEIGDLDYAKAISDFNLQQTALQAAQQSFAKVRNLSLFNYL